MWNIVAKELGVPQRAAEAMHWLLGEEDMARRAGVIPVTSVLDGLSHHSTRHPHGRMLSSPAGPQPDGCVRLPSIAELTGEIRFDHTRDALLQGSRWPYGQQ